MTNGALQPRARLVIEVIGPAGAGKTTLLRALERRNPAIEDGIEISKQRQLPLVVRNSAPLLLPFLREYRHTRWFSRKETRSMAYLRAWLHVLAHRRSDEEYVTVLDHGPLYRLALLREFGPGVTHSEPFRKWWSSIFERWTATLDLVVWLDASNRVLLQRIRARDDSHLVKGEGERDAHDFLDSYRAALDRIVIEAGATHDMTTLRFDSDAEGVEQIAGKVLDTLKAVADRDRAEGEGDEEATYDSRRPAPPSG